MVRGTLCLMIFCCAIASGQSSLQLPIFFEANVGQAEPAVRFLARSGDYALHLSADGAAMANRAAKVRMHLAGSNKSRPVGEDQLPGKVNYLIGSDPGKWHTGVPAFSRVRYRGVYPGIDIVYYGNQSRLEYDFVVAPGADPQSIKIRFAGAALHLASNGDLAAGSITLRKPEVYQDVNGARRPVAGEFKLIAGHTVGFRLGTYDRRKPLVIDPVLVFSTFLDGSRMSVANAIVTDSGGNVYVAGSRDPLPGFPVTIPASGTAFVAKLNATGTALVYSTYVGGTGGDAANGLAIDTAGNAYVAGATESKDFPVTSGAFQTALVGTRSSFVAKLNPAGSGLVYATFLGGNSTSYLCCDAASAVAVDSAGNAYVAGVTYAGGFPVTTGAPQATIGSSLGSNAFVTKINSTGSALVYSTFLGGSGQPQFSIGPAVIAGDGATALAVDSAGNAYVTGYAHSTNFPVTAGALQSKNKAVTTAGLASPIPGYNAFVTKINPSGTALVFSTYLGGSGVTLPGPPPTITITDGDQANAIAVDSAGNTYLAGFAYSADFPVTTGAFQTKPLATQTFPNPFTFDRGFIGSNAFVTKLNTTGTSLVYSTFVGGSRSDSAKGLAIDASGNAYIAGATSSMDFPVAPGSLQTVNKAAVANNGTNAFVAELNSGGSALISSTYFGGSGRFGSLSPFPVADGANGVALDASGNVYIAGSAWSADFPTTPGAFQTYNVAGLLGPDAFVAKLNLVAPSNGPPAIRPNFGVVEGASYQPVLAPGGIATVFGYNLAAAGGGTQLKIGGVAAPLFYVSPSQINFQVPWELAGQTHATTVVTTSAGTSPGETVNLSAAAPGIFTANASGNGQGAVVSLTGQLAAPATPAIRGQYVVIFCSGLGAVSNQPATGSAAGALPLPSTIVTPMVMIDFVQASINFSGLAPGFTGLYQVNALVPATVRPGTSVPLSLSINGVESNTVTIAVQ